MDTPGPCALVTAEITFCSVQQMEDFDVETLIRELSSVFPSYAPPRHRGSFLYGGGKLHAVFLHWYVIGRPPLLRYCAASDAILLPPPGSKLVAVVRAPTPEDLLSVICGTICGAAGSVHFHLHVGLFNGSLNRMKLRTDAMITRSTDRGVWLLSVLDLSCRFNRQHTCNIPA